MLSVTANGGLSLAAGTPWLAAAKSGVAVLPVAPSTGQENGAYSCDQVFKI
jgi:hypothetical protein